jgi:hypothetical protein
MRQGYQERRRHMPIILLFPNEFFANLLEQADDRAREDAA